MRQPSIRDLLSGPPAGWYAGRARPVATQPVITISRYPGSRGDDLAALLGQRLGIEVLDRELLHRIATSAHTSDHVVSDLDERNRPMLTEWLSSLASPEHLSPYSYRQHLTRVVEAIARFGGAVIVGRGAHLILHSGEALRVLVVAPLPARVATIAQREGIPPQEAERRIATEEAERRAFLAQYFHADYGDHTAFDLVVNTAILGVEGAADAVLAGLSRLPAPVRI